MKKQDYVLEKLSRKKILLHPVITKLTSLGSGASIFFSFFFFSVMRYIQWKLTVFLLKNDVHEPSPEPGLVNIRAAAMSQVSRS